MMRRCEGFSCSGSATAYASCGPSYQASSYGSLYSGCWSLGMSALVSR